MIDAISHASRVPKHRPIASRAKPVILRSKQESAWIAGLGTCRKTGIVILVVPIARPALMNLMNAHLAQVEEFSRESTALVFKAATKATS